MFDDLPQVICRKCQNNAINSYTFRLLCEESNNLLHEKQVKKEKEEEINSIIPNPEEIYVKSLG